MEKMAIFLANYLLEEKVIIKEDYEIYRYGLLTGMEMAVCALICYLIAIMLNMFGECTLLFILFFSVRSFVGGIHMKSFFSCLLCSCIVVTGTLLMIKNFPLLKIISIILSIVEIIAIFFMRPVENENRLVDPDESRLFLCRIRKVLVGIFLLTFLFYFVDFVDYLTSVAYTLGVIIISKVLGDLKNIKEC